MARFSLSLNLGSRFPRKGSKKRPGSAAPKADLKAQLTRLRTALRRRWQLTLMIGLVFGAGLYFMFIRPANTELVKVRAEVAVAKKRAENLREEFAALQSAEGAAAASARFDRAIALDEVLPLELTNQDILQAVSPLVEQAGLTLGESASMPELSPGPAEGLQFRSFSLTVSGDFPQIVKFLESLSTAKPLVTVFGAQFAYIPASAVNNTPARVELTAELRVWSSNLRLIKDIKDELDSKRLADQGIAPAKTTPTTAPAVPTSTLTPDPSSTESTSATLAPTPVDPTPTTSPSTVPVQTTQPAPESTVAPSTTAAAVSVSPGGFCSPEGATGTYRGTPYVCSKTDKTGKEYIDKKAHWREQA